MDGASGTHLFFIVSKLLWAVTVPSTALTLLAAIGLLLALRWRRLGFSLAAAGVLGILFFGLGPVGRMLTVPLEDRFPIFHDDGGPVAGVVVLGGAELPVVTGARGQPAFQESAERMMALADLSRRYPQARIVFSGGSGALINRATIAEADVVKMVLPQFGVDPERVEYERDSRNTFENALLSKQLAQPAPGERWLLVTSAAHMPRAMGCFRAAGFPVTAYPVDFRTTGEPQWTQLYDNISQGLASTDYAVREWIGLIAYKLSGRIPSLFPSPED